MGENTQCQNHAGVTVEITNIKAWQQHHEEVTHMEINNNLKDLANRLPLWATFLITGLSSVTAALLTRFFGG